MFRHIAEILVITIFKVAAQQGLGLAAIFWLILHLILVHIFLGQFGS